MLHSEVWHQTSCRRIHEKLHSCPLCVDIPVTITSCNVRLNRPFPVLAAKFPCFRGEITVGTDLHTRLRNNFAATENRGRAPRLHHALAQIRRAIGHDQSFQMHQHTRDASAQIARVAMRPLRRQRVRGSAGSSRRRGRIQQASGTEQPPSVTIAPIDAIATLSSARMCTGTNARIPRSDEKREGKTKERNHGG